MKKKIGVLGSGEVGKVLATGFLNEGHEVMIGTGNIAKLDTWKKSSPSVNVGSFADAARFGELIVLAVKGHAAEAVVKSVADSLATKTVIDATNPIAEKTPVNGVLEFFTQPNESLLERLQSIAAKANFVKAYNSVGSSFMVKPKLDSKPTMFICGNNESAKKEVAKILDTFGWEPADFGKAESARAIEPLSILWCIPGFLNNQWAHAFKLLK